MVLNSVASVHSKRNYSKALDEMFTPCADRAQGLSRALLMEYRAAMLEKKLSASTVNVRLSTIRKLVGEVRRNGIIDAEEAANSWRSQRFPKGSQTRELVDAGAGTGGAHRSRSVDVEGQAGLRDPRILGWLRPSSRRVGHLRRRDDRATGRPLGVGRSRGEGKAHSYRSGSGLDEAGNQRLDKRAGIEDCRLLRSIRRGQDPERIWNVNHRSTGGLKSSMYSTLITILHGIPQNPELY